MTRRSPIPSESGCAAAGRHAYTMQKSTLHHNSTPARVTWLTLIMGLSFPQRRLSRLAGATCAFPGCQPALCSAQLVGDVSVQVIAVTRLRTSKRCTRPLNATKTRLAFRTTCAGAGWLVWTTDDARTEPTIPGGGTAKKTRNDRVRQQLEIEEEKRA